MSARKETARALLPRVDFSADFHTLNSATVEELQHVARAIGYRAPEKRNGSPARSFFEYLARGFKP